MLPSYDDIAAIFSLRNDFAHNPIHLKDGELVLTKQEITQCFNEEDIEEIRKQLMRIEKDLENFKNPKPANKKELARLQVLFYWLVISMRYIRRHRQER